MKNVKRLMVVILMGMSILTGCKQNMPNINSTSADTITITKDYLVAIYKDRQASECIKATTFFKKNYKIESFVFDSKKYDGIDKKFYYVFTAVYKDKKEAEQEQVRLTKLGLKPKIFEIEKKR